MVDWGQFGGLAAALGTDPLVIMVRYKHGRKEMEPVIAYLEVESYEGTVAHESENRAAVRALESIARSAIKLANWRAVDDC